MAERASNAVVLGGSALPLFTVPVGLIGFAVFADGFGLAFERGGNAMVLVLGVGGLASVLTAAIVFGSISWRPWLAPFVGVTALLVAAAGAGCTRWGLHGAIDAVANTDSSLRASFMHAAVAEAAYVWVLSVLLAGALLTLTAGAFAIDFMSRLDSDDVHSRRYRLALALVLSAFGLWSVLQGAEHLALAHAHQLFAEAAPPNLALRVLSALNEGQQTHLITVTLLATALGLLTVSAVMLRGRLQTQLSLAALLIFPVGVVAVRSVISSPRALQLMDSSRVKVPLVEQHSASAMWAPFTLTDIARTQDGPSGGAPLPVTAEMIRARGDRGLVDVNVGRQASSEGLRSFLRLAFEQSMTEVELIGAVTHEPPHFITVPAQFESMLTDGTQSRVRLVSACEAPCRWVRLDVKGVIVGDEIWPYDSVNEWPTLSTNEGGLAVPLEEIEPVSLMRAAVTAAKHLRPLVVVMPAK